MEELVDEEKKTIVKNLLDLKQMEFMNLSLVILLFAGLLAQFLGYNNPLLEGVWFPIVTLFFSATLIIAHNVRMKHSKKYLEKYHQKKLKNYFWKVFIILSILFFGILFFFKGIGAFNDIKFVTIEVSAIIILAVAYNLMHENIF
jgi:hypothetical protein